MKTPYDSMLARLAVVELTGGYAYALDPNFARRTLGMGEDAYQTVLECAKSRHPLLAQNAVAVLANFKNPECGAELKRIFETTPDMVCRFRALSGLLRRHDKGAVPGLLKMAKEKDEVQRCYAFYALGMLAEPSAAPVLRAALGSVKDKDALWSALPALARIRDKSKETLDALVDVEKALRAQFKGDDTVRVDPKADPMVTGSAEEPGSKFRLLRQMAVLALAANGDAVAEREVLRRMEKAAMTGWHPSVWYLVVDVLVGLGDKGVEAAKKIVEGGIDDTVRVHALRALYAAERVDAKYLKEKTGAGSPVVRATAIHLLADKDEKLGAEVCRGIVTGYAGGSGEIDGGEAFVVATAAQVGGRLQAWADGTMGADLVKAAERAYGFSGWARRDGTNDPDITKCRISIYPALLETLVIECGRGSKAADALAKILKNAKKPPGRAEAALALGAIGGKTAVDGLLGVLDDPDGWVRFCAYLSLKRISGQDFFLDWIFSSPAVCKPMAEKYRQWFEKNPVK
jgi:HEAT repeat protein